MVCCGLKSSILSLREDEVRQPPSFAQFLIDSAEWCDPIDFIAAWVHFPYAFQIARSLLPKKMDGEAVILHLLVVERLLWIIGVRGVVGW